MRSRYGSPAELGAWGVCNRPAGGGRYAHELNDVIEISASLSAADLPRSSSRYALAGPDRVPPLGGRGNPYGPAVSTAGLTSAASVAFGRAGGVFLNFFVPRQPGSNTRDDSAERVPCVGLAHVSQHEGSHDQEVGTFTQGGPRDRAG